GIRAPVGEDETAVLLRNLLGTGVDTHRVVLLPGRRWLNDALFNDLAHVVEVLSFRWSTVGMNAQILETIYQGAAQTLASSRGEDYAQGGESLIARIPSDVQFAEAVAKQSRGVMYVAAYALRRMED